MAARGYEELEIKILASSSPARPESKTTTAKTQSPTSTGTRPTTGERGLIPADPVVPNWSYAAEYLVEARKSSGGEQSGSFKIPFTPAELDRLIRSGSHLGMNEIAGLGTRLFEALFAGNIGKLFVLANQAATTANRGLRFRLRVGPPELAALPWEILRPSDWSITPAQSDRTPLVRHIDLLDELGTLEVSWPLRVLLVSASPKDQTRLLLDREVVRISEALVPLRQDGKVELKVLEHAKADEVLDELRGGQHHVVHFMMHGDFDPAHERGVLVLEDDAGASRVVDAESLALAFFSEPGSRTRLVLFNACKTADDSATVPGRGIAAAVARLNMPAVVAMQYPISDTAAIRFARELYIRLAQGRGIDEAVSMARAAIRMEPEGSSPSEWITPVLYLRARDSRLFQTPGLHHLDYTPDANRAKEVLQRLEDSKGTAESPNDVRELVVSIRPEQLEANHFQVSLTFARESVAGTMDLTEEQTARVRPWQLFCEVDPRAPAQAELLRTLGEDLFSRLFAGDRAFFLRQALAQSRRSGLRLSLVADDEGIDAVPWEYLRDPYTHRFLNDSGTRIVFLRQIPAPNPGPLDPVELPLRILFVSCNPRDMPLLDLEREWDWFQKGIQDQPPGRVEITRLRDPTLPQLIHALDEREFHIFHFAGFDSLACGKGDVDEGLLLINDDAQRESLLWEDLSSVLGSSRTLRLAVTNTCYTASRLAPMLVRAGIPAAIGMRFAIQDDVAIRFCAVFYKALFKYDLSVASALAETRRVLFQEFSKDPKFTGHWSYPTLVTSVPGAYVFGVPRS